jgi:predicted DNA-binding transcriptional regulator AlpA
MAKRPQLRDERPTADAQIDRLIPQREVLRLTGMRSPTTIDTWEKEGKFPAAIRLNSRCKRWRLSAVQAWINTKDQGKGE